MKVSTHILLTAFASRIFEGKFLITLIFVLALHLLIITELIQTVMLDGNPMLGSRYENFECLALFNYSQINKNQSSFAINGHTREERIAIDLYVWYQWKHN